MNLDRENVVQCYLAVCPVCRGVVMIATADPANPSVMASALKERRACERAGLLVETLSIREGKARLQEQFGHVADCVNDPRRNGRTRKKTQQQLGIGG